jgi:hypothetical protein
MAGKGLPHFEPAPLASRKSAAIYGLLMLLMCHALIIRDPSLRTVIPGINRLPGSSAGATPLSVCNGKRTVSLKSMDFALWQQPLAGGYSVHRL